MNRAVTAALLLAFAVALGLRCPQLAIRPLHNDEAVNAVKFNDLREKGFYKYDPDEFHGPTLHYASLALARITAAPDYVHFDEARLRLITVLFGAGLILLLFLVADGLGRGAVVCAGLLTAVSPAMVFYSRYFIHEMLLVFFTFLAIAAGWRYLRERKVVWAGILGAAIGLMQATKETFVLPLAAAVLALVLNQLWTRRFGAGEVKPAAKFNRAHLAWAAGAWLAVVILFFSSFFTNGEGLLDAVRTYLPWLKRAGGASPHLHPWDYYFTRVLWSRGSHGVIWSEGLILALALVGILAACFRRQWHSCASCGFIRFLAFYSVILAAAYSVIAYKTPWCLLGFWQGLILLAGVGVIQCVHSLKHRALKTAVIVVALAGMGQLACQAWRASVTEATDRHNPYVYSQTSPDLLELVEKVEAITSRSPQGRATLIKVMAPGSDFWPLPWYLRAFSQTGWYGETPPDPWAPIMIVSAKFDADFEARKTHILAGTFELRPQVFLQLYVSNNLWQAYLNASKGSVL